MSTIDFSKMNDEALLASKNRIDRFAYPENYDAAVAEIKRRGISEKIFEEAALDPLRPRPWIRFFARGLDAWLVAFPVVAITYFLFSMDTQSLLTWVMVLFFSFLYESYLIHTTGTTIAKSAFGITVRTATGQLPTWRQSLVRSLSCFLWGSGLDIIAPVTYIISYFRLKSTRTTKWDKAAGVVVTCDRVSVRTVFILYLLAFALTWVFLQYGMKKALSDFKGKCASECSTLHTSGQLKGGMDVNQCIREMCK